MEADVELQRLYGGFRVCMRVCVIPVAVFKLQASLEREHASPHGVFSLGTRREQPVRLVDEFRGGASAADSPDSLFSI